MASTRPEIDSEAVKRVVWDVFGLKVNQIKELNGYDDRNFHVTVDREMRCNDYISETSKDGYVLKIVNSCDSQNARVFAVQSQVLIHLQSKNIDCPQPITTKKRKHFELVSLPSGQHVVRLLNFIPGNILFHLPNPDGRVFFQVGALAAKIDSALEEFNHLSERQKIQWCLGEMPDILNYLHAIDEEKRPLIRDAVDQFTRRVLAIENSLPKGLIHGDINEQNLLVDSGDVQAGIKAVIDFGDSHYCCYLYELALAMTYMILLSDSIDSGGHVLAGYRSVREISEEEIGLLKVCVVARFCQSLVLGALANLREPENNYVLTTAKKGWIILEKLSAVPESIVLNRWRSIAG